MEVTMITELNSVKVESFQKVFTCSKHFIELERVYIDTYYEICVYTLFIIISSSILHVLGILKSQNPKYPIRKY